MSVTWVAVVAGLIAIEKTIPWRRVATYAATTGPVVLGVLMLVAPGALSGLNVPSPTPSMSPTGS